MKVKISFVILHNQIYTDLLVVIIIVKIIDYFK